MECVLQKNLNWNNILQINFKSEDAKNFVKKVKVIQRQAEVALGVSSRLMPPIFDFRHYKDGSSSAKRTGRLYPGEMPGIHFQRLSRPQGTWFCRKEPRKKIPSNITGERSQNRPTSRAAP
jgi:hypothetical protein